VPRTKIVATIGPASDSPEVLRQLIRAGMDMARLSLAHGPVEETLDRLQRVRDAAEAERRWVGILADLPGPKIRAAEFPEGGLQLTSDEDIRLVPATDDARSDGDSIAVAHDTLLDELEPGDLIAIGDGTVQLQITDVGSAAAEARIVTGGWVQGRPGVALPANRLRVSSPTDDDLAAIERLAAAEVDAVAISFVRSVADIERARAALPAEGPMLVAKIETQEAVDDLDAIIAAADGVMVARGDLGIRCALEDVPHYQKRIIRTGVAFGRPVITATQMLESMVRAAVPTRAEVSDVANAVLDGTSALMLSGETAIGHHPVDAVRTMATVAERAEEEFDYVGWGRGLGRLQTLGSSALPPPIRITAAISAASWRAAQDADVAAIIACTRSGDTARAISRFRPRVPVLAATPDVATARQLAVAWGITPVLTGTHETTDEIVWFAVQAATELGAVKVGDIVAVLVGSPTDPDPTTDTLRLVRVR
jgi:pyruvate kinase